MSSNSMFDDRVLLRHDVTINQRSYAISVRADNRSNSLIMKTQCVTKFVRVETQLTQIWPHGIETKNHTMSKNRS